MTTDPKLGYKVAATIIDIKGKCNVGHKVGESFEISCHNPAGLCGFFYNKIFPGLQTFQFGGSILEGACLGGKEIQSRFNVQIRKTL